MKKISLFAAVTILFLCSGCLYIPYHRHVYRIPDKEALASMKEGVTSKEDILMMLGEPNKVLDNERRFLYWWEEEQGTVLALLSQQAVPVRSLHWLYIVFDDNNTIKKCEIKRKDIPLGGTLEEHYDKEKDTSLPLPPYREDGCGGSKVP